MTPEEEARIRELQRRAANNDQEAATMLALLTDENDRSDIASRAQAAYALPEISLDQHKAGIAADTSAGTVLGTELYEDKDKWSGKGLLGTPFAALMNQTRGQKEKKQGRIDSTVGGLRRAREDARMKAEGVAERQGKIAGNEGLEKYLAAQRVVSNRREDAQTGRDWSVEDREIGHTRELEERTERIFREDYRRLEDFQREDSDIEMMSFHDPDEPSKPLNLFKRRTGFIHTDGRPVDPALLSGLTEWKSPLTGSRTPARSGANRELDDLHVKQDARVTATLNNFRNAFGMPKKEFRAATGPLDWQRHSAKFAGEDSPFANRVAKGQRNLRNLSFEGMADMLEVFTGTKSDAEMKVSFDTQPTLDSEPGEWVEWAESDFLPKMLGRARAAGLRSEEEIADFEIQMREIIDAAKLEHLSQSKPARSQTDIRSDMADIDAQIKAAGG